MPAPAIASTPTTTRVARLGLVVSDLEASTGFFAAAFDAVASPSRNGGEGFAQLMGLPGARSRQQALRIGDQEVLLVAFDPPGRPYPVGSTSTDLWFQHFAIIVSDMAAAHARLERAGRFTPITAGGPVTLPAASGAVEAFKFRDADGHPLELLAFPAGGAPPAWQGKDRLVLGIDHSAISVADTAASVTFLRGCFGLEQSMQSENVGPEQARMDGVDHARVTVTGMAPQHAPPHVELLGYHVGARRPIDGHTRADDLAATFFVLETEDIEPVVEALASTEGTSFVSAGIVALGDGARAVCVLDPDGHRFVVEERR